MNTLENIQQLNNNNKTNPSCASIMTSPTARANTNTITPTSSSSSQQHLLNPQQSPEATTNQQDLIRLLAQHFNNQFYQLAQNANTSGNNNNNNNNTNTSADMNNVAAIAQYQQQLQQTGFHHNSQELMNHFSSNGLDLVANHSHSSSSIPFAGQLFRSNQMQPTTTTTATTTPIDRISPIATTTTTTTTPNGNHHIMDLKSPPTQLDATMQQTPMLSTTSSSGNTFNELNLLNALNCFNLTPNDQFMLSLHQQYLLQAAASAHARQYGSVKDVVPYENHMHHQLQVNHLLQQQHQQHQQHQHQQQHQRLSTTTTTSVTSKGKRGNSKVSSNNNLVDLSEAHGENGRELLKFSINTILGRGSPMPSSSSLAALRAAREQQGANIAASFVDHQRRSQHQSSTASRCNVPTKHNSEEEQSRRLESPECDPNVTTDFSSDSSLPHTPTNRQHEPASSSTLGSKFDPYHQCETAPPEPNRSASELSDQVAAAAARLHHQVACAADASRTSSTMQGNQQVNHQQQQQQQHPSLSFLAGSANFPWTVAARGKPRRGMMRRAVFSDSQRVGLEKRFQLQKYISKPDRKKLADKLGLRDSQVKIWFQNRRMKWRNSKERELLSAGGSREQTLPTRNNPNPDLSDVGETIKKSSSSAINLDCNSTVM